MARGLRLWEVASGRRFIVEDHHVYEECDGRISRNDAIENFPDGLFVAVGEFYGLAGGRVPGLTSQDGRFMSGAILNAPEQARFEGEGVEASRPLLQEHLSFFDPQGTGSISFLDNYCGWRALGFGPLKSMAQTIGSAAVFGWRDGGTIVIEKIASYRPHGSTGLYDAEGFLDEEKWHQFLSAFGDVADDGVLTHEQARQVLASQTQLGKISARQFESLYYVASQMNGSETVTLEQIGWLYDGSLLWRAALQRMSSGFPAGGKGRPPAGRS